MSGNIMSGLMAGANFGTGFQEGQQANIQNSATNRMNEIAIQDAQLRRDQQALSMKQQQVLSDKAMELFSPGTSPGDTVPPANIPPPGQTPPQGQSTPGDDNIDPSEKLDKLANFAAGSGDLTHANELWTNASNLRNAKFEQAQKQSAMQTAELKRQQMHYGLASQYAGTVEDSPAGFNQWKMAMLSDPNSSPEERNNIANMQYAPGIMDKIRDSGMTASQAASARLKKQSEAEKVRINDLKEAHTQRQDLERAAHDRAMETAKITGAKVGAISKAPSANDLSAATLATKEAMGGDKVDTKDPAFLRARENVSARALQIVRDNRAVTYPQAVTMAAGEAKKNGEFVDATTPDTHAVIFGHKIPFTGQDEGKKPGYQEKGATRDTPLPLPSSKADLVPGKWYTHVGQVEQYTGK